MLIQLHNWGCWWSLRVNVAEKVAEMKHMAAGESYQCLLLIFCERFLATNTMTWRCGSLRVNQLRMAVALDICISSRSARNLTGSHVNMILCLHHNIKLDAFALTRTKCILCSGDLTTQYTCDARADAVLNLVFLDHTAQALPEPIDL